MDYKQTLIVAGIAGAIAGLTSLLTNIDNFGMVDVYRTLSISLITGIIEALQQYKNQSSPEVTVKLSSEEKSTKLFLGQK